MLEMQKENLFPLSMPVKTSIVGGGNANPNQIIEALIPQQDTGNHLKSVAVGEGPGCCKVG